ncbi:MAG: HD domain-containing protein [Nitrospirae bacterium]|nr:MAG: HD domain-containing protein [Nitrospirota bacterium]
MSRSSAQANLERQLMLARAQLAMYARDLRMLVHREQRVSRQLKATNLQLRAYARDLKVAFDAEHRKARELERAYADTLLRLTQASRYKDEETGAHIQRLSHYARTLARSLGLSPEEVRLIAEAAPMHDVGKVGIPDAILRKPGPLTPSEWAIVKRHPEIGANLLAGSPSRLIEMARSIALTHHERWDGSGYPAGLKGERIPLAGRIVMFVDTYDALRSRRPYKKPLSHRTVCDILLNGNGRTRPSHFDPRLLETFSQIHEAFAQIFARTAD